MTFPFWNNNILVYPCPFQDICETAYYMREKWGPQEKKKMVARETKNADKNGYYLSFFPSQVECYLWKVNLGQMFWAVTDLLVSLWEKWHHIESSSKLNR